MDLGAHPDETEIEQYSMGTLASERLQSFEEHFLACEQCQDQLLQMEAYVNAVRSVSPRLRAARSTRWGRLLEWPPPVWAMATAATALLAILAVRTWTSSPAANPQTAVVILHSSRGVEGLSESAAVAGRPLSVEIDLAELPALSSYRLEIVASSGKPQRDMVVFPRSGRIVELLSNGLPAGRYYVRLYGVNGEMLREFGLRVAAA